MLMEADDDSIEENAEAELTLDVEALLDVACVLGNTIAVPSLSLIHI